MNASEKDEDNWEPTRREVTVKRVQIWGEGAKRPREITVTYIIPRLNFACGKNYPGEECAERLLAIMASLGTGLLLRLLPVFLLASVSTTLEPKNGKLFDVRFIIQPIYSIGFSLGGLALLYVRFCFK